MGPTVFLKLGALGDMVQCLPALRALKDHRPGSRLIVVTMQWSASFLGLCPWIDEVIAAPGPGEGGPFKAVTWLGLVARLRSLHPDMILVGHRDRVASRVAWLTGAPVRIGFDYQGQSWNLTVPVPYREDQHEVDRHVALVEAAGCKVADREPRFTVSSDLQQSIRARFGLRPEWPYLVVHPTGGSNPGMEMPIKQWGVSKWAELCDRFVHNRQYHVVLVGGPEEMETVQDMVGAMDQPSVVNLAGRLTVEELAGVLSVANVFVGGDSGPLHMAAALGVPTVGVFGPTDPDVYGVKASRHQAVWNRVPCAPCFTPRTVWEGQKFSACPIGTHVCMKELSVDAVWKAIQRFSGDGSR